MRLAGGCTRAATDRPALFLVWTHKVFAPEKSKRDSLEIRIPAISIIRDILRRQTSLHLAPEPLLRCCAP